MLLLLTFLGRMRASRTQLREPGLGKQLACEGHTAQGRTRGQDGTERVRFRFRAGGKEERAEQPAPSSTRRARLLQNVGASSTWDINVHLNSKQPKVPGMPPSHLGPPLGPSGPLRVLYSAPHQSPQGSRAAVAASSSEVESDMSIMRKSCH